jgi:double-stranded uracil-DNA glycosylase
MRSPYAGARGPAAGRETHVRTLRPRVAAVLGITTYRDAFRDRDAVPGPQPRELGGAALWVVPNPSGLNAHATLELLATAYAAAATAAGIRLLLT